MPPPDHYDRLAGALLGTALGDALGLPAEGMSAAAIARRFGRIERFRLLGATGFVSDDTELSALLAQSLCREPEDPDRCAASFRRSLAGWVLRLPWGVGMATLRAGLKAAAGLQESGVASAGNGAAMRAGVLGVFWRENPDARGRFGAALARVTHTDPRAVGAALFAAEVAARCALGVPMTGLDRIIENSLPVVRDVSLREAIERASGLARQETPPLDAAAALGNSGFSVHTAALATYCFRRHRGDVLATLADAVACGGDADTMPAVLGAWLGALHGGAGLPAGPIALINDGPFGPTHLRALARCLADLKEGRRSDCPEYSALAAMARNLALYPVILAHGLRRLLP